MLKHLNIYMCIEEKKKLDTRVIDVRTGNQTKRDNLDYNLDV